MEVRTEDDVERQKRRSSRTGEEEEEEEKVDATGVTSMLLLRVTTDGGKVSGTRRKVAQLPQKLAQVERDGGFGRLAAVLGRFVNERGSLSA